MPAPHAASSAAASQLYPLAIIDAAAHSFRLILQAKPPVSAASLQTTPVHQCHNAIVRTRPPQKRTFVGSEIELACTDFSSLTVRLPIERGLLTDWVAQKALWDVEIASALDSLPGSSKSAAPSASLLEGWNLILTEAYFNLPEIEQGLEAVFFDEYRVKSIWRTTPAQLAHFAPLTVSSAAKPQEPVGEDAALDVSTQCDVQGASPPRGAAPTSRRPKRQSVASSPESKRSAQPASAVPAAQTFARHRRAEASIVVDIGHSYTHVVPVWQGEVLWAGVKRLDVGGKLMGNLLKEQISFRQWDMMEETLILTHIKEQAVFTAASAHEEDKTSPRCWGIEELKRVNRSCRPGRNPIEQEYALPDYTDAKTARDPAYRYGRQIRGPGLGQANGNKGSLDDFVADPQLLRERAQDGPAAQGELDEETDEDSAGEDYRESDVEDAAVKRKEPSAGSRQKIQQMDEEQVLHLSQERWQIPELLFHPHQIGIQALGLPALIMASVTLATQGDEALQGAFLANVVLMGGVATMPGLQRRLQLDLQSLAPEEFLVRVRTIPSPSLAAVHGALHAPAKFVAGKLVSRTEWDRPTQVVGAGPTGTQIGRQRFGSWSSPIFATKKARVA
ncbi:unnamed protein product [Parajaminaea phylloscopi]